MKNTTLLNLVPVPVSWVARITVDSTAECLLLVLNLVLTKFRSIYYYS
eukprot:SAG31_NODE_1930_length_6881_cov_6.976998_6_plen_48_part_00